MEAIIVSPFPFPWHPLDHEQLKRA
jgi:hypothetical protein